MADASSPTPERALRGPVAPPQVDDAHFRTYWRACDRIEKLLADGLITPDEWRRAAAWRADCERAVAGTTHAPLWLSGFTDRHCRRLAAEPGLARLAALGRLRAIAAALGPVACQLLEAALVEEQSWAAIGRRWRRDPKTARAWVVAAIAALATV